MNIKGQPKFEGQPSEVFETMKTWQENGVWKEKKVKMRLWRYFQCPSCGWKTNTEPFGLFCQNCKRASVHVIMNMETIEDE